jgi:FKBP-type peptidyl-prolyl cis-trans isomerase FkpA
MDGSIFDSTSNFSAKGFQLNQLIKGWQIGLPKIQTGGQIKLLVSSALAYGCSCAGTKIPSNSSVYFEIKLVSFQ